jgi:acetyl esterase/lipase
MMKRRCWWAAVLLVLAPALAGGQAPERKRDVVFEQNLVYGKGSGQDLKLDLARPRQGAGPFPAVVCLHGGGWRAGSRHDLDKLIQMLAGQGFVAVSVGYRLAPAAHFPAQIEDCKAAVRWLRAHARQYHLDPDRVGALGFSAGGHLACLLGTADRSAGLEGEGGNPDQSSRVQAVVSFFGPTDFSKKTWSDEVENVFLVPFLGAPYDKAADLYRKASPLTYVSKDDPPFLFFHGTKDPLVNVQESENMVKKLQEVGVSARLVRLEGEGHGWAGEKLQQTLDQAIAFLKDKLKK